MSAAAVKRRLVLGTKIQMVKHDWFPVIPPKLAVVRQVTTVQTNEVQFSGGSWLYWDKNNKIRETPRGFEYSLEPGFTKTIQYEWR